MAAILNNTDVIVGWDPDDILHTANLRLNPTKLDSGPLTVFKYELTFFFRQQMQWVTKFF